MPWESDDEFEIADKKGKESIEMTEKRMERTASMTSQEFIERKWKEAPPDAYRLVYIIVSLNGICTLLPWNMFINIAPNYYVKYWFSPGGVEDDFGRTFMKLLGIAAQTPNFLMAVINVLNIIRGPILWKIRGALIAMSLLVTVVLGLVIFTTPSKGGETWFFTVSLIIVCCIQLSTGLYQNSLYGLTADFPDQYTNAVVVGDNFCGIFISCMELITTVAFPNNPKTVAILYFSICLGVLLFNLFIMFYIKRFKTFNFYMQLGHEARLAGHGQRPNLKQYWQTVKLCWPQFVSVFLVFFVTLSIFPTVLVDIKPLHTFTGRMGEIYYGLTVFLNFNFFAAVGNLSAVFIQFPPPKFLLIPVALRLLFIPYFMLCNFDTDARKMGVIFKSAWFFIIANTIMAFTSGYFSSLAMMYAPASAPPHLQKTAGQIAALCLVGGVMAGVAFAPLVSTMVEHIDIH